MILGESNSLATNTRNVPVDVPAGLRLRMRLIRRRLGVLVAMNSIARDLFSA